jgi:cell division transport system permease protein
VLSTMQEAWRAVTSAHRATISSVLIITLCLTILGLLGLVALALEHEASEARRWITVEAFLSDSLSTTDAQKLRASLVRMPGVVDAHLVTKEEAVIRFEKFFDPGLLTALETNPLPRSFLLDLTDNGRSPASLRYLVAEVGKLRHVTDVQADIEWLTTLNRLIGGAATVVVLLLLSVGIAVSIVIARTISLGISARIHVVEVMRLIGAPESLVRRPFIIVGLAQGLLGGLLAGGLVMLASHVLGLIPLVGGSLGGQTARIASGSMVALGLILGWWGSHSALSTTLPPDPWDKPPEHGG